MINPLLTRLAATATVASAVVAGTSIATTPPASASPAPCFRSELNVSVPVGVDVLTSATIHAVRYTPAKHPPGVQILVPGVTYDHHYYDLQTDHGIISQAQQAAKDGWVTIAVDRIGTGGSSQPPPDKVTTATNIASLDHFVDRIDRMYRQLPLVLVGHSYGSVVAEGVAAQSTTVDALVVTGSLYRQTAPSFDGFPALVPVSTDPVLQKKNLPTGYLITASGSRAFFYSVADARKTTLKTDERTKATTTTASEVPGFAQELFSATYAGQIRVPVLVAVGEHDFLYKGDDPAAFRPDQEMAFAAAVNVTVAVVPNAAHDLALQRNADQPHRSLGNSPHALTLGHGK